MGQSFLDALQHDVDRTLGKDGRGTDFVSRTPPANSYQSPSAPPRTTAEFAEVWGDPLLANAGPDRLAHRANVLLMNGRSYRLAQQPEPREVLIVQPV